MSNSESDGSFENEWDDRGELAWNEFDWENYLRTQDALVFRYLKLYEKHRTKPDRIDLVAHQMGWDEESWSSDDDDGPPETAASNEAEDSDDSEPYTVHKNPIFISTKAICQSLKQGWEKQAADPSRIPQAFALSVHSALYRCEEQAMLAVNALDFGDYAMAISLFKRALRELNQCFSLLTNPRLDGGRHVQAMRDEIFPKLFDLREIWFRVINECREELERPTDDDEESE
ncbi:MAG: hypothetical protein HS122_09345 [Opitutaceae bacterium]|nr:hypothetical protein [Opitutaceae bacterium]